MPTVTAIKQQKRTDSRFSIEIDGEYAFSLGDLDLSASNLRVGASLTKAEVEDWQQRSSESKAYNQALRYLQIRLRSQAEIERYLVRKGWDEPVVVDIVARLVELGLVDDNAFAAAWIRERKLLRPRSAQALRFELIKLGVGKEAITAAMEAEGGADEVATIMALIERRQRQYPDHQKLMAYLGRQGFRYDQIKTAFERISEQ